VLSKLLKSIGILFFLSGAIRLHSQTAIQFEKAADQAFYQKDFYTAYIYYTESLDRKIKEDVQLKSAVAAYEYGAFGIAIKIIEELLEKNASQRIETIELYHGFCLFSCGEYTRAKQALNKYLSKVWFNKKKSNIQLAEDYIKRCDSALFYDNAKYDSAQDWTFFNAVNSKKADFAYAEFDELKVISSTRRGAILVKKQNGVWEHAKPRGIAKNKEIVFFEKLNDDQALTCVCAELNQLDRRCQLKIWLLAENRLSDLGGIFESDSISFSQPFIDKANNQLYFSSDGFNSKGGKDIFYVSLDSLELVDEPKSVSVNSEASEESPFVREGVLYFSSDRSKGLGGYDIYSYNLNGSGSVMNLGRSYNSSYDENYYRSYGDVEYLSSNRALKRATSIDAVNCLNIYKRPISKEEKKQENEELISKVIPNEKKEPEYKKLDLPKDDESIEESSTVYETKRKIHSATVYFSNAAPRSNSLNAYDYEDCIEEYDELIDYYLNSCPEMDDFESFYAAEVLSGIKALQSIKLSLDRLLESNQEIMIEINAFTSPRASKSYNKALSERRCNSVLNYLINDSTMLEKYIKEKKIQISCNAYGEQFSPAGVSSDLNNRSASVYSIAASRERRVECILKVQ
jgi:hypothetical protein